MQGRGLEVVSAGGGVQGEGWIAVNDIFSPHGGVGTLRRRKQPVGLGLSGQGLHLRIYDSVEGLGYARQSQGSDRIH